MAHRTADVAVIGGGAIGTSILFHLSEKTDFEDVVLFEKNQLGSGSTSKAAGGIRNFFTNKTNIEIGNWIIDYFQDFERHTGVDLEFRQTGYIYLYHTESGEQMWEQRRDFCVNNGASAEMLSASELEDVFPELDPTAVRGGVFATDCGHVDPSDVTQAFARAATDNGDTIETKTEVTDVIVEDGEVTGVETDDERWDVDFVINAAGPWAPRIGSMVSVDLPIELMVRRIMVTSQLTEKDSPLFIDPEKEYYFEAEQNGSLLICNTAADEHDIGNPSTVSRGDIGTDYYLSAFNQIEPLIPAISDLDVINGWAGIQSHTPDGNAIVGPTNVEGFYVACGFSGHGVQQAPMIGTVIADLLTKGKTDRFEIDQFRLDGFKTGERGDPEEMA